MGVLVRALDWTVDNVGNIYFIALAAATVVSIALAIVLAIVSHQWLWALVPLAWPAMWLAMLRG